jgi:hypothetical protein
MLRKLNCYVTRVSIFLIIAALIAGMVGCDGGGYNPPPSQNLEIRNWYDLDAVRDNLAGNHTLMNDLNSTTPGYEELAGPTANGGKGWQPIGIYHPYGATAYTGFMGTFDGQGYEIRDLYINRPDEVFVGLFGELDGGWDGGGVIRDMGVVNVTVIGGMHGVGGLVGVNIGTVSNCYCSGEVTGNKDVGGLVGATIADSTVIDSYFTGNVIGNLQVGGLAGRNHGTVSNSHSTGNVTGVDAVGGLVGSQSYAIVSNSYSTSSVTGNSSVGGLVGINYEYGGTVSNSYFTGSVSGTTRIGGVVGQNGGTVSNCFWDIQTSGQATSAGGAGKTTAEMQDIATFSGAGWDIIAVAPGATNTTYIWNIVNGVTYPFLSWQAI